MNKVELPFKTVKSWHVSHSKYDMTRPAPGIVVSWAVYWKDSLYQESQQYHAMSLVAMDTCGNTI